MVTYARERAAVVKLLTFRAFARLPVTVRAAVLDRRSSAAHTDVIRHLFEGLATTVHEDRRAEAIAFVRLTE